MLRETELRRLTQETLVRSAQLNEELPSTNSHALRMAAWPDVLTPLLVAAKRQTAGRGRGENSWWSAEGALTFSLLLDADEQALTMPHWPQMSLTVGLAVCEALAEAAPEVTPTLKWPNDVYIDGRKACGVLIEPTPAPPHKLVIGVGVNVNNRFDNAPDDVREKATSLAAAAGRSFSLAEVLHQVLARLTVRLAQVATARDELVEQWRGRCLLSGRVVRLDTGERRTVGLCKGIDSEGALLIETEQGVQRCFGGVVSDWR